MAKVIHLPGGEGYVNEGEKRVVDALAAGLPHDAVIYPNVQVVTRNFVDDVDAIVITPDIVMAIETKDLAGRVQVSEQRMFVDCDDRANPFLLINYKARRIWGKITDQPKLKGSTTRPLVVLARRPLQLEVDESMKHRIVSIEKAIEMISSPENLPEQGVLAGKADMVAHALGLKPREAVRKIGQYRTDRILERSVNEEVYEATHQVTGEKVRLRRLLFPPGTSQQEINLRESAALRAYKVARAVDDTAHLIEPGEVFRTDDGSLVVTSPANELVSLAEWAAGTELSEADRRRIVTDVADGLATLHRAGIAHGHVSAEAVRVSPMGAARLGQLGAVRLPNSTGSTVVAIELNPFFAAPESLGESGSTEACDLYALGRLIDWLWPADDTAGRPTPIGPPPEELAAAAASLTVSEPAERFPSAAELSVMAPVVHAADDVPEPHEPGRAAGVVVDSFELIEIVPGAPENVWRAMDRVTGMDCVVKFFPGELGVMSARNQHILLNNLNDDGVLRVRHVGLHGDGAILVTELLKGTDLGRTLRSGTRFDVDEAIRLVAGVLRALEAVHGAPEHPAHGDVKPDNLVLSDGRLVLVDFELAVPPGSEQVSGSPDYLPPDVAFGEYSHDRDLYAIGVVLHELLTGVRPEQRGGSVVASGEIPERVGAFIARATAPLRKDRFGSATAMANELDLVRRSLGGWQLGDLVIEPIDQFEMQNVAPMGGGDPIPVVTVDRSRVTLPSRQVLVVDVVSAPDGSGWVITSSTDPADPVFDRLKGGLRMGCQVDEGVGRWAELRQARLVPDRSPSWSNMFKASLPELDEGSGLDVPAAMKDACGGAVGTRADVLGDDGPHRSFACATFPDGSETGPLAAYLVTRVLPLMRGVGGPGCPVAALAQDDDVDDGGRTASTTIASKPKGPTPAPAGADDDMEPRAEKGSVEWEWEQYRPRYKARPETFDALVDVWLRNPRAKTEFGGWSLFSRCANGEPAVRDRMPLAREIMRECDYEVEPGTGEGKGRGNGARFWPTRPLTIAEQMGEFPLGDQL